MLLTSSNANDIDRYYNNTYVKFKEYGEKLFFIQEVNSESIVGKDEDGNAFALYLDNANPYELAYTLPHRAVFQYKDGALLLRRMPAKQYRRGICNDNTTITRVDTGDAVSINFEILKAFVNKPKYFTFTHCFNKPKQKSLALSPRMSVITKTGIIKVDWQTIGQLDMVDKVVHCRRLFIEDLQTVMKNNNESFNIKEL